VPLELDHVDGNRSNNELANRRLLCPNCHAPTDTYRGRSISRPHGRAVDGKDVHLREAALGRLRAILAAA
jgi:hypothetical protein